MAKISINLNSGSVQKEPIIVGIDLGTTNSLIAAIDKTTGKPFCIAHNNKQTTVPSIVSVVDNGNKILVGLLAHENLVENPQKTVYSVKRLMGKTYNDVAQFENDFGFKIIDEQEDKLLRIQIENKFYTPIELSSYILKDLKHLAEKQLNETISQAVITVPAYFNDAQRQATKDAGKLAGLEVLRIVNEPTAASLAYGLGLSLDEEKLIVVYDLGGGTFDVSILQIQGGIFEVLATNGDTFLGGDDIDRAIINHWEEAYSLVTNNESETQQLRLLAENAKKILSTTNQFKEQWNNQTIELSLEKFNELIEPLVAQTLTYCKRAISDAKVDINKIDEVVLVGGSTRTPKVKESVAKFFNQKPNDSVNPDEVVALGAAVQADILAGNNKDFLLLDVTPLSLGIETVGGLMDTLIPRNSKIPSNAARQYTTSVDGQVNLKVSVYQGERDLVSDNRKLAEFILNNIPAMPAGLPKIEIGFTIDADGILQVKAKELRSGVEQVVKIKPAYGITEIEMAKMLKDSLVNAQTDMDTRALIEAQTEAQLLVDTTKKFLVKNDKLLTVEEIDVTNKQLIRLNTALTSNDKNLILTEMDNLNMLTKSYAERVMDIAISEAIKGKNI